MHLIPKTYEAPAGRTSDLETIALSDRHLDYLGRIARAINPDMPASLGLPHLIRTILDRVEQSGVDLTDASSEEDIARLVAGRLRQGKGRKTQRTNERLFSSCSSATRRSYQSTLPERGRFHSGKPPRSGRG